METMKTKKQEAIERVMRMTPEQAEAFIVFLSQQERTA